MLRFALASLVFIYTLPLLAADWALKDYAYRRAITFTEVPPGATAAHVRFATLGATRPDLNDIRVFNDAGQMAYHEVLRNGPGDQVELLFECPNAKAGAV